MFDPIRKKIGLILSINDPRWGRGSQNDNNDQNKNQNGRKPEGPPDLDELWRDLNQRLNRLFGGRGGNGGGGGSSDMRGAGIGAFLIGIVLLLLWLASGFFIVQAGQTAVVLTFGKKSYQTPTGINWRWPYPIQSHETVNVSQFRTVEVGYRGNARNNKQPKESLMLTDDENIIDIQFAVQYKIKDAENWLFENREPEEMVRQVAETSIREVVGKRKMDSVLYEERDKVGPIVQKLMQEILDRYKSGVMITSVAVQGVQPPEQVQSAFDDVVKAGQDSERLKNEGEAYAKDVTLKASGTASRLKQDAEAYRERVIATAEGDAARFKQVVAEYQKAPAVTRDRMYLETMQQIFANTSKVMIDAKSGSNLLYLPLEKLIAQTVAQEAVKSNATLPTVTAAPQEASDAQKPRDASRSRDVRESREREGR